jgi:hypothetical protein
MGESLAQIAAAINKARGAWMAAIAIGTLALGGVFTLAVFIASENLASIRQLRLDVIAHEARIARLEGAAVVKPDRKEKP